MSRELASEQKSSLSLQGVQALLAKAGQVKVVVEVGEAVAAIV